MSRRYLPSINRLAEVVQSRLPHTPHARIVAIAQRLVDQARTDIRAGAAPPTLDQLAQEIIERIHIEDQPTLRPVINGSGVIIQTNLGRAPLSKRAQAALQATAAGYSNVEYDLATGERGSRHTHLNDQLVRLTGAEAALVVNNAAAALLLSLSGLAQGREVLVSRGQAVEIGGGFRIPDLLRQSGCTLVEVGTTNRTYAHDYAVAITPQTAAILRVHRSNFALIGFVHEPTLTDLVQTAHDADGLVIDDVGSGALLDPTCYGLAPEPLVQDSVAAGADLVIFSGDKLLGGPQAGIIVGRAAPIAALKQHPLVRALRVDKLTIAALQATLSAYENHTAITEIPVWQMISATADAVRSRAERLAAQLHDLRCAVDVVAVQSTVGGGALPGSTLPSYALALQVEQPDNVAAQLRANLLPVIGRIQAGQILLDVRTIAADQEINLIDILHHTLR